MTKAQEINGQMCLIQRVEWVVVVIPDQIVTLLESDMNPKISDLGLARALRGMDTEEFENIIIGTT